MDKALRAGAKAEASGPRITDRRALILALVLGLAAAVLIVLYLRNGSKPAEPAVPMLSVVVAARDIAAGERIAPSMIEMRSLPETAVAQDTATAVAQVVDKTVRYPVTKGETIGTIRLVDPTKVQALSFQIPPGRRGFTIPVNVTNTPAGLLAPGDFVDVIASTPASALGPASAPLGPAGRNVNEDLRAVVTLLQNIQVLAVHRQYVDNGVPYDPSVRGTPPKEGNISDVTLALTPEESQLVWMTFNEGGRVTLSLRAFGDAETKPITPTLVEPPKARPLSFQIPAGKRAFTLPVNVRETPASFIVPGDFVDVLATVELKSLGLPPPTPGTPSAQNDGLKGALTLLQNIQVLAVHREYLDRGLPYEATVRGTSPQKGEGIDYVTLAIAPDQAQLLWLAVNEGKISLSLRSFGDAENMVLGPTLEPLQTR